MARYFGEMGPPHPLPLPGPQPSGSWVCFAEGLDTELLDGYLLHVRMSHGRPGFRLRVGGGGSIEPPCETPPHPLQKGLNGQDPQNPTETDPRASEVTILVKKN